MAFWLGGEAEQLRKAAVEEPEYEKYFPADGQVWKVVCDVDLRKATLRATPDGIVVEAVEIPASRTPTQEVFRLDEPEEYPKWGRIWSRAGKWFATRCANALMANDLAAALKYGRYYRKACDREDTAAAVWRFGAELFE